MPDGDVWVLFRRRQYQGARAELPVYAAERPLWRVPTGVGRFSKGKWQFPARLEGIPETIERRRTVRGRTETQAQPAPIRQIVRAGGKLFVVSAADGIVQNIADGKPNAAQKFVDFISAGTSMYTMDLFRLADVDMSKPEPVQKAFGVLASMVDQMESLVG